MQQDQLDRWNKFLSKGTEITDYDLIRAGKLQKAASVISKRFHMVFATSNDGIPIGKIESPTLLITDELLRCFL